MASARQSADGSTPERPWTYQPLAPDEVRWYWATGPLSLKAWYKADILGKGSYLRFCRTDSLSLEMAYRKQADDLERAWWDEHGQLAAAKGRTLEGEERSNTWQDFMLGGDSQQGAPGRPVRGGLWETDLAKRRMQPVYFPEGNHRVLRGFWFVEQGSEWIPLKETVADELETAYKGRVWAPELRHVKSQKQGIKAARVEIQTFTGDAKGMYALFASSTEMYLCRDDSMSWLSSKWSKTPTVGAKLRRGYIGPAQGAKSSEVNIKQEQMDEAAAANPPTRLLLVVHGIGQNLSGSNIAQDAQNVRMGLYQQSHEHVSPEVSATGRIEVLPVQWRKQLNLEVDTLARLLMPPGIEALRGMLHATAVEVLLYLTPSHCHDMLTSLIASMNSTYAKFMRRYPGFKGPVSLLAHSLGSVLSYDILCNQPLHSRRAADPLLHSLPPPSIWSTPSQSQTSKRSNPCTTAVAAGVSPSAAAVPALASGAWDALGTAHSQGRTVGTNSLAAGIGGWDSSAWGLTEPAAEASALASGALPQLNFDVDQLICAGSPLGLFLALRGINPAHTAGLGTPGAKQLMPGMSQHPDGDGLPAVRRLYNLYQPYDPVAYRLEPLIFHGAEKRKAAYAAYHRGGRRIHVGMQEFGEDMGAAAAAVSSAAGKAVSSTFTLGGLLSRAKPAEAKEPDDASASGEGASDAAVEAAADKASAEADTSVWRVTDGQGADSAAAASTTGRREASGRLDFVLQSSPTENPWLSAISSHFSYWTSSDTALFVLRAVYGLDVLTGVSKPSAIKK
ncbi:hypothetical protein WJX84_007417 [Apatococcus fuscideae]|uniref:DDHD domain-containing protein n=1 Tax=Apatococcus fuscideae TaxID=2026836 RepID=A0AAW1SPS8_9CHLO